VSFPPVAGARRTTGTVSIATVVILLIVLGLVVFLRPSQHRATGAPDAVPAPSGPYVLTAQIREAGARIWLSPEQLAALHVQFDSPWPKPGALGMYLSHARTIIVNPDYAAEGSFDLAGIIAYEYMHDVWSTRTHPAGLTSWMDEVAASDPAVDQRLSDTLSLDGSSDVRYTELLSITCTQTTDAHLRPELVAYCDQELPGRRNLPATDFPY
jgi:hypothetical protein